MENLKENIKKFKMVNCLYNQSKVEEYMKVTRDDSRETILFESLDNLITNDLIDVDFIDNKYSVVVKWIYSNNSIITHILLPKIYKLDNFEYEYTLRINNKFGYIYRKDGYLFIENSSNLVVNTYLEEYFPFIKENKLYSLKYLSDNCDVVPDLERLKEDI